PVAAQSQRTATRSITFAGYRVDAETPVLIATALPHMLPELFPSPERFDVARYRAPRNEHRVKGAYAPFGLGAHTCLGAGMAEVQIAVVIARLLHNLEFELTSERRPPLRQDPTLTFGPKFRVRVSERRRPLGVE
ncbi:MAG TPA: cytochrome P450, partial [Polyangiaceae bacterium]|nr:cytochrome P450 [Polyangiaceae bacterium]